jgi:tRNA 2-thiouridine synthesizing protein A
VTDTDELVMTRLVKALAGRDRPVLDEVLDGEVVLRALLPRRYVELVGAEPVAEEMLGWFAEVPEIAPVRTGVDTVGDVWHAALRLSLRGIAPERVVEQHAYCAVEGGVVAAIRLICSGSRPVDASPAVPSAVPPSAVPLSAAAIDALGEGCATLTPRIAAALRGMAPGEVLAVLADDPSAPEGIAAWSRLTGHQVVATAAEDAGTRIYLRHR